ncbi:mevalonate kinase [Streptomyces sp. NPDC056144]|uniref:mevalonate kinase family protein n=1 Tax=unclassified Streptomyces TaxID=2593676 RepID=UPI0035DC0BBB
MRPAPVGHPGLTVLATAPGKVVLSGEHAAVLGRPALTAALGRLCTASIAPRHDDRVALILPGLGVRRLTDWPSVVLYAASARARWAARKSGRKVADFAAVRGDDPAHVVLAALGETLRRLPGVPGGVTLTVESALPPGSGFGSSAAVAVATCAALLTHEQGRPQARTVAEVAARTEELQHGTPSGIDTATVRGGGVLWLAPDGRGAVRVRPLSVSAEALGLFELHHTGPAAESTGQVVAAVRPRLTPRALDRAERATTALRDALTSAARDSGGEPDSGGERDSGREPDRAAVIEAVRESARFLEGLGVVPPPVARTVRAVEAAGGAAKICGAGSLRGPGAGALLVVRPPGGGPPIPGLDASTRISAPLGVPGLQWEKTL